MLFQIGNCAPIGTRLIEFCSFANNRHHPVLDSTLKNPNHNRSIVRDKRVVGSMAVTLQPRLAFHHPRHFSDGRIEPFCIKWLQRNTAVRVFHLAKNARNQSQRIVSTRRRKRIAKCCKNQMNALLFRFLAPVCVPSSGRGFEKLSSSIIGLVHSFYQSRRKSIVEKMEYLCLRGHYLASNYRIE